MSNRISSPTINPKACFVGFAPPTSLTPLEITQSEGSEACCFVMENLTVENNQPAFGIGEPKGATNKVLETIGRIGETSPLKKLRVIFGGSSQLVGS